MKQKVAFGEDVSSAELHKILRQGKVQERVVALEALFKREEPQWYDLALAKLTDRSSTVRAAACELLGEYGNPDARAPLLQLVSDKDAWVRTLAIESLGTIWPDEPVCPPELLERLDDPDDLVRLLLTETLGIIGDPATLPALWQLIGDNCPVVRRYAASVIGELEDETACARLETALKQETSDMAQVGFYEALYRLGKTHVLPDLLALLNSRDYRVRCATANTLGAIANETETRQQIIQAVECAAQIEPTVAAKSTFVAVLQQLGQMPA
ncbi:MAG: HEAT repeat domain-containing protein [Blastocatellia bacterium]|nr:HEAT repeat domain-containing protein [Blastocatellia bacterium]